MSAPTCDNCRHLTRRRALTGAVALGAALPLAACASGGGSEKTGPAAPGSPGGAGSAVPSGSSAPAGESSSAAGGSPIAKTSDIEVGGGRIFADKSLVVTQPRAGEFKAFDSICTHQACPVTSVSDGQIVCSCHGSHFSIEDGSVQSGPAPAPLPSVDITVQGDQILL